MKLDPTNRLGFEKNNFDLLRLVFALMVCLVHMAELSAIPALEPLARYISSPLAVKCFFVISGFLIARSFHNTSTLGRYVEKRLRRIYPAYLLVVLSCAFLLVIVSDRQPGHYFTGEWLRYVFFNLLFLNFVQPGLPGVFEGLKNGAVNGALWTLKVEVMFYLFVPVMALACARFNRLKVLVALYLLSVVYFNLMAFLHVQTGSGIYLELQRQLPGQLAYFVGGSALFYYFDFFTRHMKPMAALAALGLVIDKVFGIFLCEPLALSVLVLFFATYRYFGNFSKYGDFSYGVYILHFPIIQCVLVLGLFQAQPVLFVAAVLSLTLAGSFLLWHGVEKRFLRSSNHYNVREAAERMAANEPLPGR